jgi:hypothetical protein
MTEKEEVATNVARTLNECHEMLCDDLRERSTVESIIHAFHQAGLLTNEQARLRSLSLNGCPGHNGSRVWCAYCGDLQEDGHG